MPKTEWAGMLRRSRFAGEAGVFPVDVIAIEGMRRIGKEGTQTLVSTRTPRNLKQHRLAWALAQKLVDCCDWLLDRDNAMDYLKKKAGHVKFYVLPNSEVELRTLSIAWAALPQEQFTPIFDNMIKVICEQIVPGLNAEDLRREVLEMAGGELGRRAARGGRGEPNK